MSLDETVASGLAENWTNVNKIGKFTTPGKRQNPTRRQGIAAAAFDLTATWRDNPMDK